MLRLGPTKQQVGAAIVFAAPWIGWRSGGSDVARLGVRGLPRQRGSVVIVAFSVTPLSLGEDVGEAVADAVRVVRESGLPNHTDAMFTSIEGEWDEVMAVVKRAVDAVRAKSTRVSVVLKADIREGVTDGLTSKVASLERHLASR
jgi:uncharacterized protein (TIGR00106 family)